MRNAKTLAIVVALGLGLIFSSPFVANAKKGGGGGKESQAGGLPALEDRVEADEALITTLQGLITTLQTQVAALQAQVAALQALVTTLQTEVATLLEQNNFAVVAANGTLARSNSSAGPVSVATHTAGTGLYEVDFSKDVSGCAYVATLGDTGTATPPVGFVGVAGATNPDGVTVQTSNSTGTATDEPFHLSVSCP